MKRETRYIDNTINWADVHVIYPANPSLKGALFEINDGRKKATIALTKVQLELLLEKVNSKTWKED